MKYAILISSISLIFGIVTLSKGQTYKENDSRPVTFVCSYCGQQSAVPIQGAACGFEGGQNHNWIPVK